MEGLEQELTEDLPRQILECKKLALARKREGDLDGAKQALLESKRLQLQLDKALLALKHKPHPSEDPDLPQSAQSAQSAQPAHSQDHGGRAANTNTRENTEDATKDTQDISKDEEDADLCTNDDGDGDGDGGGDGGDDDNAIDNDIDNEPPPEEEESSSFSLAEMMDLEMMAEFASGGLGLGLPIPSLEEYQTKMDACKRAALSFKQQGKTNEALQQMRNLKQLQVVYKAIEPIISIQGGGASGSGSGSGGGGGNVNGHDEEETEEEKALLRELLMAGADAEDEETDNGDGSTISATTTTYLELDDLIQMDLSEIKDAMALGMRLPSVETIQHQVNHQKTTALQLKQAGDLEGAKAALVKFKTWSQHASAIEQLLLLEENAKKTTTATTTTTTATSDDALLMGTATCTPNDIREEDLEKLLEASSSSTTTATTKPKQPNAAVVPKPKSSEELRQEAIRLRDEKKLAEATAVLKLYKQALARESEEAEMKKRQEICQRLQKEILDIALKQQDRFYFYQRFVNTAMGSQQLQAWWRYADLCKKVVALVETKGSNAVTITAQDKTSKDGPVSAGSLRLLPEDLTEAICQSADPTDERLECCILDVMALHTNKAFQTTLASNNKHSKQLSNVPDWVQLETHVSIQLPLNETETDKPIDLHFYSRPLELKQFWDLMSNDSKNTKNQEEPMEGSIQSMEYEWSKRGRVAFGSSNKDDGNSDVNVQKKQEQGSTTTSQYVTLERGDSKFAKTILRRMERRKITISVHCHSHEGPSATNHSPSNKLKGWFGGAGSKPKHDANKTTVMEPLNLGKVVLETKELLDHSCVVGEYPLVGNGKREVGGTLRLCLRTGVPFHQLDGRSGAVKAGGAGTDEASSQDELPLYSNAMKFSVNKPDNPAS